ncbi:MAG: BON domain-containing protein, partial [Burkholderiales bacterium]
MRTAHRFAAAAMLAAVVASQAGCFTVAATGTVVGALAVVDRRTFGAQTEDQAIELKATSALGEDLADSGAISVTSYNRNVLLTGQVADPQARTRAGQIVAALDNVRSVHNEL